MSDIIKFEFDRPVDGRAALHRTARLPQPVRRRRRPPHVLDHRRPRDVRHATDLGAHQGAESRAGRVLLHLQAKERPLYGV